MNFKCKQRGIFGLFGLKNSRVVHVTHFHPFRQHKLTERAKKWGVGSLVGWSASLGSFEGHSEKGW
jgi:hypothetical protein